MVFQEVVGIDILNWLYKTIIIIIILIVVNIIFLIKHIKKKKKNVQFLQ